MRDRLIRSRSWLVVMLFTTTLFVFATKNVAKGNLDEFVHGFPNLLLSLAPAAGLVWIALAIPLALLPRVASAIGTAWLLALSALLYVQGNFLVWDYGHLDGNAIDWDRFASLGMLESALWFGSLLAATVFRARLIAAAVPLCAYLLAAQGLSLGYDTAHSEGLWQWRAPTPTDARAFRFSRERNVVVLVLDAFQSSTFEDLIEDDPTRAAPFDGFVFFRENVATYSTTAMSIPAMLTGRLYDNQEPQQAFLAQTLGNHSIASVLKAEGYETDLITLGRYCQHLKGHGCTAQRRFAAMDPLAIERRDRRQLVHAALFRHLPHPVKRWLFNEVDGRLARGLGTEARTGSTIMQRGSLEITDLFERRAWVDDGPPTFKFVHHFLPHKPLRFDGDCALMAAEREASSSEADRYLAQSACALRLATRFIDLVKDLGVYDETLIVIASDHGMGGRKPYTSIEAFHPAVDRALPLLLAKPLAHRGELATSTNPTELRDIPKTIAVQLGVPSDADGVSIFEASHPRARSYYHYVWQHDYWDKPHLPPIQEFIVEGPVRDITSWRVGARYVAEP